MEKKSFSFESIGTWWEIDTEDDISEDQLTHIKINVLSFLDEFDKTYSRFIEDSLVNKIGQKPGQYTIPPDGMKMLELYKELYQATHGAFTPLIGQILSDAGYDANYSFEAKELTPPPSFSGTVRMLDDKTIQVNKKVILDFGGIGKGFAIDKIGEILQKHALQFYTINAGGDIFHYNALGLPLRIGMEHPINTKKVIGVVELHNESICSSAGNRRKWGKFHHIINPHTLSSPENILAVWVTAETTTIADALATCLFLTKPEALTEKYDFEYFILYPDFSFNKSQGFKGKIFAE